MREKLVELPGDRRGTKLRGVTEETRSWKALKAIVDCTICSE